LTRPDLIFVSLEDWDDVWRRNQFVCDALARRHPDMKILFVGLPRDVSHGLRHGDLGVLREPSTRPAPGLDNVTVVKPIKLLPDSIWPGRWVNRWVYRRRVRREARRLGMAGPTLWLNPYSAGHLIGRVGERRVVYDITDDWELADVTSRRRAAIHQMDRDLCRRADLTIVCSEALADSRRAGSRRLLLLPNGVDLEHYRRVSDPPDPLDPPDGRPVFGYTGTLHPDRIDVDLVLAVAAAFPRGTIYLIGPNELSDADSDRLRAVGNVRLTGPMRYADLPAVMARFDVCIVPHRRTAFTESLNPIKLWEYLAAGKPIVTTPVAGFRDYPDLCRLAGTADEFIAGCHEAVAEGSAKTPARQAEAAKHTWASRVDRLEQKLTDVEEPAYCDDPVHWTARRVVAGILRRARLHWARFRHHPVRLGRRCDVRGGFRSMVGPRGAVAFGDGCVIDRGMTVEAVGVLTVGPQTIFGHHCTLASRSSVRIGAGCMFAEMVSVRDHDHRSDDPTRPFREQGYDVKPVVIGSNVWLGAKVTVLKGVTIGDNTVVGAHAVVTRDLPANVVAAGVPARVIRSRRSPDGPIKGEVRPAAQHSDAS
jgi:teichuronic acid biosynthesis glycosyltransferase TuaH